jgi:hypothetical protein
VNQWRYYAGAGLFAAVISLISGILGGNPFGVILLRMLLSALVLAGVALGVGILLRKFLPELMQEAAAGAAGDEKPEAVVDIVLPEENPHQERAGMPEGASDEALDFAEVEEPDDADTGEAAVVEPLEELDEEAASEAVSPEVDEEVEEAIPLEEDIATEGNEEIDTLPDMEQFDSTNYVGPDISGLANGGDDFTQAQVDGIMSKEDPAQLAKAVRTFLKKDQEG